MGKLLDRLNKQLKTEYKQDAEECIKVYNKIKEVNNNHVWDSVWNPLTSVKFEGKYPNTVMIYSLSPIGKIFLKGIE